MKNEKILKKVLIKNKKDLIYILIYSTSDIKLVQHPGDVSVIQCNLIQYKTTPELVSLMDSSSNENTIQI